MIKIQDKKNNISIWEKYLWKENHIFISGSQN